jgi:broad specificity phosphatase PhoE
VRHAEAYKNVLNQHGGSGSDLSPTGIGEAHRIGQFVRSLGLASPSVKAIDKRQCLQTAQIIAEVNNLMPFGIADLPVFYLGVLDGRSEEDVQAHFPELAELLSRWRTGNAEAHELTAIPGATDPAVYFEKGKLFLVGLKTALIEHDVILVATRSVLVLLTNILLGRNASVGGGYREVPWPNNSYATFSIAADDIFRIKCELTNVAYFA